MSDPVILIGLDSGKLALVGLYASLKDVQDAIGLGDAPTGLNYSVMTPKIGSFVQPVAMPNDMLPIHALPPGADP